MKNNKGISLITLIVTIMVMLILIGVVGTYSLDTIKKANEASLEREFANVREYVLRHKSSIELGTFDMESSKYPELVMAPELAYLFLLGDGKLLQDEVNNIVDVNLADIDAKYKYYFFQADSKCFEDPELSSSNLNVQDVKNDYVINFASGTIICVAEDNFKVEGLIKGLGEFLAEE